MSDMKVPAKQNPAIAGSRSQSDPLPDSELEAATASEIRTKLDLARQFLDMGDPESARHILDEVLEEGDSAQSQEAKRLIESMPGTGHESR
jgi:pilus assembly protein FimV